jgi:recombination protein RecT
MQNQQLQKNSAPASKDNFLVVRDLLERSKNEIAKALPKSITPERVARIALTTLRKNPGLLECDPNSFLGAVMQASQLGFELDDNLGLAYLVPFYNKKRGIKEAQLVIGYRGLIELARRSGKLKNINARVVYENEPFTIEYGLMENLKHIPLPPTKRGNSIKGVYAVATMNDNSTVFDFLWAEELEEIKKAAIAKSEKFSFSSPWTTHTEEMMKKTTIRKLMKYLSLSPEIVKATVIDEYGEAGINTKDTFLQTENNNKTLGMTEPKAITSDNKVVQLSDHKTNEPPLNDNANNQTTAPETTEPPKAQTDTCPDTFTTEEDNGYFADIPWDEDNMSSTQTEPKAQNSKKKVDTNNLISDKQINFVYSLCHNKEIEITDLKEIISSVLGTDLELEEINKKDATVLIDYVKNLA